MWIPFVWNFPTICQNIQLSGSSSRSLYMYFCFIFNSKMIRNYFLLTEPTKIFKCILNNYTFISILDDVFLKPTSIFIPHLSIFSNLYSICCNVWTTVLLISRFSLMIGRYGRKNEIVSHFLSYYLHFIHFEWFHHFYFLTLNCRN